MATAEQQQRVREVAALASTPDAPVIVGGKAFKRSSVEAVSASVIDATLESKRQTRKGKPARNRKSPDLNDLAYEPDIRVIVAAVKEAYPEMTRKQVKRLAHHIQHGTDRGLNQRGEVSAVVVGQSDKSELAAPDFHGKRQKMKWRDRTRFERGGCYDAPRGRTVDAPIIPGVNFLPGNLTIRPEKVTKRQIREALKLARKH